MENVNNEAEELKKIKELLDGGIITQKEFEKKKKQLLKMKKKITPLKVIGIILLIPTTLLAVLMVIIFVLAFSDPATQNQVNSSYQQNSNELTAEERFAVDYLVIFSELMKNPHSIKLHKVWVYRFGRDYYVAYNFSVTNSIGGTVEVTYGNSLRVGGDKESIEAAYILEKDTRAGSYWKEKTSLMAKEHGKVLDKDKIQKAFEEEM